MISDEELRKLDLCRDFCTCGNPDPLNESCTEDCLMVCVPVDILEEVDGLVSS